MPVPLRKYGAKNAATTTTTTTTTTITTTTTTTPTTHLLRLCALVVTPKCQSHLRQQLHLLLPWTRGCPYFHTTQVLVNLCPAQDTCRGYTFKMRRTTTTETYEAFEMRVQFPSTTPVTPLCTSPRWRMYDATAPTPSPAPRHTSKHEHGGKNTILVPSARHFH